MRTEGRNKKETDKQVEILVRDLIELARVERLLANKEGARAACAEIRNVFDRESDNDTLAHAVNVAYAEIGDLSAAKEIVDERLSRLPQSIQWLDSAAQLAGAFSRNADYLKSLGLLAPVLQNGASVFGETSQQTATHRFVAAVALVRVKRPAEAISLFDQAWMHRGKFDREFQLQLAVESALCLVRLKRYSEAELRLKEMLKSTQGNSSDTRVRRVAFRRLLQIYREQQRWSDVENTSRVLLTLPEVAGDPMFLAEVC